jgi:phage terminase large subunit GpA-like protein
LLTAAVDVQHNRFACLLMGWGRGPQGWFLDYVELPGDPTREEDWAVVDQWLDEQCLLINAFGVSMKPLACAVDSSAFTQDVYDYVRRRQHKGVFAVKGSSWGNRAVIGRPTLQDINHRGKAIKQGVQLWPVGTDTAKANLTAWLVQDGHLPAREEPASRRLHFPSDLPADPAGVDCFAMLASEKFDSTYKRGGQVVGRWVKRPGVRNELLDCLVYGWAAAHHPKVRLHTMREADWLALEKALQPEGDLFASAGTTPVAPPATAVVSRETNQAQQPSSGFGSEEWAARGFTRR